MQLLSRIRRAFIPLLALLVASSVSLAPRVAFAASMDTTSISLSDSHDAATSVTYSLGFTTETGADLKQIDLRFSTTNGGTSRPDGMALGSAGLGQVNNLGSGWDLDTGRAGLGILSLTRSSAITVAASSAALVVISGITNPTLRDCDSGGTTLFDTCYFAVTTYSDDGTTSIDAGSHAFTLIQDPSLSFEVSGIASGQTHNGVTTTVTTTGSSLPFGTLAPGTVEYAAHSLTLSTNAPGGYKVYAYLPSSITGADSRNLISPFGATDATWSTPQAWDTPTGTTRDSNSGWFAANTTDTRVPGWTSSSAKFGPISTTPHVVAQSTGPDSGTTIYVSYALGINSNLPSDSYSGTVLYDVQASY